MRILYSKAPSIHCEKIMKGGGYTGLQFLISQRQPSQRTVIRQISRHARNIYRARLFTLKTKCVVFHSLALPYQDIYARLSSCPSLYPIPSSLPTRPRLIRMYPNAHYRRAGSLTLKILPGHVELADALHGPLPHCRVRGERGAVSDSCRFSLC